MSGHVHAVTVARPFIALAHARGQVVGTALPWCSCRFAAVVMLVLWQLRVWSSCAAGVAKILTVVVAVVAVVAAVPPCVGDVVAPLAMVVCGICDTAIRVRACVACVRGVSGQPTKQGCSTCTAAAAHSRT